VHPGAGGEIRRALGLPAFAECGTLLLGPYDADSLPTRWQRLQLTGDVPTANAHLRLFTLTSDLLDGAPGRRPLLPVACGALVADTSVAATEWADAPRERWRAAPLDALDILALDAPARWLWIGAQLVGDGSASPTISQLRLAHDEEGWIRWLPALYRRDDASRVFLQRALAAFEGVLGEGDALIDALPRLFDAYAASDDGEHPSWLEWLADLLDADLRETWDDATRRGVITGAFRAHAIRGTRESLRRLIQLHTGATPFIEEAFVPAVWSLGASGALGVDTGLAAASADGAVLGVSATVDRSHLIPADERGAPLFDEMAHRFTVRVYASELEGDDALARLRALIDREKPAHTTYHLCPIDARMRVGAQARVGIDTIVGGPPPPSRLDGTAPLGESMVLGGTSAEPSAVRVGSARAR
jgi:phage tail-like protein